MGAIFTHVTLRVAFVKNKQQQQKLIERVNDFQERVLNIKKELEVKRNKMGGRGAGLIVEIINAEKIGFYVQ